MSAGATLSRGLVALWVVIGIIGVLSPGKGRNYELLGTHWMAWSITAVLLSAAYFLVRERPGTLSFRAALVALFIIFADMVVTTTAVIVFSAATQRQTQPIEGLLMATSCGVGIAIVVAIGSVVVGGVSRFAARR